VLISGVSLVAQQPNSSLDPNSEILAQATADQTPSSSSNGSANDSSVQKDMQNATTSQSLTSTQQPSQTKRILDVIPNFRSVSAGQHLPPMSAKQKFIGATEDSFDYSAIFVPAVLAGYSMWRNSTPEFGSGGVGYGRYLWHTGVDQTSENYMVEFIVPSITHEDPRYYTLGSGGFLKRTGYALSRAVITRSDSGNDVLNLSELVGSGASSGISSLYYPSRERSFGSVGREWGLDIAIDAASFEVKEFWPDVNHWLFHGSKPASQSAQ
jgi:hypothetical protein